MAATPAWPPASLPRLYVDTPLEIGARVAVEGPQAHYLAGVMRLKEGAWVGVFDNRTGDYRARIVEAGRKRVTLEIVDRLRPLEPMPDLWLLFAPIKRGRIDWLVEKATELGAARLCPVMTRRTVVDRLNLDRLRAHSIEAAEQCERSALPEIAEPQRLDRALAALGADRTLYFADEEGGTPIKEAVRPGPAAILIGPEGGFTPEERVLVAGLADARPISLGPRILRADTAAIAALAIWMSAAGDWTEGQQRMLARQESEG